MPGGHIIRPLNQDIRAFEITDTTIFNFVDIHLLFVEDEDGDRQYMTTYVDKFILHLETNYSDRPPAQTVPFLIEIVDGQLISVTEDFRLTI